MNSLDHQVMEACVVGKAGREEIGESTNLFVISRVTTAYEGRPTIVSAEAWDREGRPGLDPMFTVYGVTDLVITEETGAPSPVFRVDYVKWAPLAPPDDGGKPRRASPRAAIQRDTPVGQGFPEAARAVTGSSSGSTGSPPCRCSRFP